MKLHALTATNFRGLTKANIHPKTLNFITGPSGSGKSSLMDAIRYAMTGKQISDQIHTGAYASEVVVEFEKIGVLERQNNRDGKTKIRLNEKTTTAKSVNEQVASIFGFQPADTHLLTSSEVMEHALGKDLAEYLLNSGFLSNDMSYHHLLELNPMDTAIADELEQSLFPNSPLPKNQKMVTLELIEEAYQQYRSSRPSLKKLLAEEQARAAVDVSKPSRSTKEIAELMTSLQAEIAAAKQKAAEYPKALKDAEMLQKNLDAAKREAAQYESVRPVTPTEKAMVSENLKKAQQLLNDTKVSIASTQQAIKPLERTLELLSTSMCPISSQLICTTDKTGVKAELEASLQMQKDTVDILMDKLKAYEEELCAAQKAVNDCIQQENNYQMKLKAAKHLSQLQSVSIAIPAKPDPNELTELTESLNKLRAEHQNALQYEMVREHAIRAEALQKQLATAETLVKELAPNGGIRKLVLSHSIGPMEDVCNEYMKIVLPKYKLHFNADDNFNVVLEHVGGQITYDGISKGEQLRVLFVLMLMLNQLNQVRVILLDNLNDLDVDSLSAFMNLLEELDQSHYDQIYLSGINHDGFVDIIDRCKLPHAIYECDNGVVSLLKT